MKKTIKIISLFLSVILLSSCSNGKVLKTKEISKKITQTKVVLETDEELNNNYENYFSVFSEDFIIPGLFEGFIPQGICYDLEGTYIISGYYEDEALPSMLISVDSESGKLKKAHPLKNIDGSDYFGHAGGIACSGEYIFITSDSSCFTISTKTLEGAKNGVPVKFESKFKITTKGSFAGYNEGVLWIGDFIESSDKEREKVQRITTLESGETFYAYCEGYILENNLPSVEKINSTSDGYIPDYYLAIPEQVQGIAFTKTGKITFTSSYGRKNDSNIYIFSDVFLSERVGTINFDDTDLNLLACSSDLLTETIKAPPMAEGITTNGDEICMIFESGAAKYRNHGGKHPLDNAYTAIIE